MEHANPDIRTDCCRHRLSLRESGDWRRLSRRRLAAGIRGREPAPGCDGNVEIERVDALGVVGYHLFSTVRPGGIRR